ncbi:lamin tail domain-containing protein [Parabacteroides pacaensis]|uniref:lamin tail domain-containing protein n=1 Tax=Parabacteroides pacaensis TaxID=2086575 RepID=UPI000D112B09|nr:lamin tail domain-containing protein [Parabacteroides pacaensis]
MKQIFSFFATFLLVCLSGCYVNIPFTDTPALSAGWSGDTSHFQETEEGGMWLSSLYTSGEVTVYMPAKALPGREYKFTVFTELNPSSRNYARVYLWSKLPGAEDPEEAFFVRLGYTKDNVSLCHQIGNKAPEVLIEGRVGIMNSEWSEIAVRVTVGKDGTFCLFTCTDEEDTYLKEGEYRYEEGLPTMPGYFMLNCKFTSKGSNAFSFEDISIEPWDNSDDTPDEEEDPASTIPELLDTKIISSTSFLFVFDRKVNVSEAVFTLSGEEAVEITLSTDQKQITVSFEEEMEEEEEYQLTWEGIKALKGEMAAQGTFDFVYKNGEGNGPSGNPDRKEEVEPLDIIINEILFDPFSGGSEYFELYNRSAYILNISGLSVATRKKDNSFNTMYPLSAIQWLNPGEYRAFTKKKENVLSFYSILSEKAICEVPKLPTLSNTGASLVLWNRETEEIIDEVTYSSKWHATLVKETKGVSLERISTEAGSQDPANWTSASADAGYGTPGYKNSQSIEGSNQVPQKIEVGMPVREPGKDSYKIAYTLDESGYMCKSAVYDTAGRLVASIASGETLGKEGFIRWDGKRQDGKYLRPGLYIFYIEFYHTNGKAKRFKKGFVVTK